MLSEFIDLHRNEVITRSRAMASGNGFVPLRRSVEPEYDEISLFVEQLGERLRIDTPTDSALSAAAKVHGHQMLRRGFDVAQVVQSYGAVCEVVTELAMEKNAPITTNEFQTLNHCLDMVMAEAVKEYECQRDLDVSSQETERLGLLAHELRNLLGSAMMSFDILRSGSVSIGGSTGAVLGRSLRGLHDLIDGALAEVRIEAGLATRERISISAFVQDLEVAAAFEAKESGVMLVISCSDAAFVEIDRHLLASAVGNLLQNAFKFTRKAGLVRLDVHSTERRVYIQVSDECGGLPAGTIEKLFRPFAQGSDNRTGLGLGLAIVRRGVEANGGELRVRDVPGKGCEFVIELPRA